MYERKQSNQCGSDITGVVAAMGAEPKYWPPTDMMSITHQAELHHKWGALVVAISILGIEEQQKVAVKDKAQAMRAMFDWIDALPPAPPVDRDAMDRGEIY